MVEFVWVERTVVVLVLVVEIDEVVGGDVVLEVDDMLENVNEDVAASFPSCRAVTFAPSSRPAEGPVG